MNDEQVVVCRGCENWKAGRVIKVKKLKQNCWTCFYNLFGYCWFDDCQLEGNIQRQILSALRGDQNARKMLHKILEIMICYAKPESNESKKKSGRKFD